MGQSVIKQTFISVENKSVEKGSLHVQKQEYNKKVNIWEIYATLYFGKPSPRPF